MDHALLVRVLYAVTEVAEQLEPLAERQCHAIAVVGDRLAAHVLHHEVGAPVRRGPAVEDLRDGGVIHHRQRLAFGLEPRHHLGAVHPRFDHLDRDLSLDRTRLVGQPDLAHAAFADLAE